MDQQQVNDKATVLVYDAENGNTSRLSEELNRMSIKDRVAVAHSMQNINNQDVQNGLPKLDIDFWQDKAGNEHLTGIHKTEERSYYNPNRYLSGKTSREDVYSQSSTQHSLTADYMEEKTKSACVQTANRLDDISHSSDRIGDRAVKAMDTVRKTMNNVKREGEFFEGKEDPDSRRIGVFTDGHGMPRAGEIERWDDGRLHFSDGAYSAFKDSKGQLVEFYPQAGVIETTSKDGKTTVTNEKSGSGYEYRFNQDTTNGMMPGSHPASAREFDRNDPDNPRKNHSM